MKAGVMFILTINGYSDYSILATMRALVEFDFDAELAAFAPPSGAPFDVSYGWEHKLVEHLSRKGIAEEVVIPEMNFADGGRIRPVGGESGKAEEFAKAESWVRATLCFAPQQTHGPLKDPSPTKEETMAGVRGESRGSRSDG